MTGHEVRPALMLAEVLKLSHPEKIYFTHNPTLASTNLGNTTAYYMQQTNITPKGVNHIVPVQALNETRKFVGEDAEINYAWLPKVSHEEMVLYVPSTLMTEVVSQSGLVALDLQYLVKLMAKWGIIEVENSNMSLFNLYSNPKEIMLVIKELEKH